MYQLDIYYRKKIFHFHNNLVDILYMIQQELKNKLLRDNFDNMMSLVKNMFQDHMKYKMNILRLNKFLQGTDNIEKNIEKNMFQLSIYYIHFLHFLNIYLLDKHNRNLIIFLNMFRFLELRVCC